MNLRPAFSQCPVADAGPDQALCSDQSAVQLSGNVTGGQATGLKWSSNGTGTFSSTIGLTPIYYPSVADKYTGEVTITLTVKSSTCDPVTNTMIIDLNMLPVIKAGADQVICSVDSAKLTPETLYAPNVTWSSSGSGSFFPSSSAVNASYVPSEADIAAGNVKLTFTASDIAGCPTVVDDLTLKIDKAGSVDAGPDLLLCSTARKVLLKGKSTGSAVKWTSSGWGVFSNTASAETEYQFYESDRTGVLTLTLSSNDACHKTSDQVNISWVKGPEISFSNVPAGEVCSKDIITFDAVVTPPYRFITTTSGKIDSTKYTSNGNVNFHFVYTPSKADSAAGKAVFRFQGVPNEACPATDSAVIKINRLAVDAGPDLTVCNQYYFAKIPVLGSTSEPENPDNPRYWEIKNATGKFSSTGNGVSNYYLPGSIDTLIGKIELRFVVNNRCGRAEDIKAVTFVPSPKLMATVHSRHWDTIACPGQPFPLQGKVTGSEGVLWHAAGTGYFSPNATSVNTTYIPSELDIMKGSFEVMIVTTGNNACQAQDTLSARFITPPAVNAGPDLFVSADQVQAGIHLHGTSNEVPAFYFWTSAGTGTFSSNTVSDPVYFPTAQDIANGSVIMTLGSIVDNPCDFKDEMRVTFVNTSLASISGSVLLGDKSKAAGTKVTLFLDNNGSYIEVESFVSLNGDFIFSGKPAGKYLIYATPQNELSKTFVPTYSGNVREWTEAKPIALGSKNVTGSITLLPYIQSTGFDGYDNIAGTVTFSDLNLRVSGGGGEPVSGATVYLSDGKENELSYTSTNEYGMFLFSNLAKGKYYLKYEYPGVKPLSLNTTVDGDPNTLSSGSATLERNLIVTSVNDVFENTEMLNVAPNPASEFIQVNTGVADGFEYTIINSSGMIEFEGKADRGNEKISLEGLSTGIYVVKIIQNNNVLNVKIFIK